MERILALPTRPPELPAADAARLGAAFKAELGLPNAMCACRSKYRRACCVELRPVQVQALHEIRTIGGLVGPLGVGHGKAIALDTPIPTPVGWTTMGALRVGDIVFDSAGRPCRVTHATEVQHDRACFDVRFSDGSVITADADHRWLTRSYLERRSLDRGTKGTGSRPSRPHEPQVRTTLEIRDTLKHRRNLNHAVDAAGPLHTNHVALPLDPYVLGAWLGDGATGAGEITSANPEILQRFDRLFDRGHSSPSGAATSQYYYGLMVTLREVGVLGNKHVPAAYLRASAAQRLELLKGLMDTDGHAASDNTVEFCNTNESLALAVFELAASLGQVPKIYNGRATLYGRDCGPKYRVCWQPTIDVFSLRRKSARLRLGRYKQSQIKSRRYIEAVTPRPSVPVRCITVDSPDHSYLCGRAMITTHNTLVDLLAAMVLPGVKQAVLLLPPNLKSQLLEADWHYYGQHWKLPNLAGGRWHHPDRPLLHVIAYSELSGAKNSDLLSRLKPDLIILDEAHNVANASAARTKRYKRYLDVQKPKQVAMSGTLVKRALSDYAHISNASLGAGSPTPHSYPIIEEWTQALDPKTFGMQSDIHRLRQPGEQLMAAFRRRLITTPGVVSSGDLDSCESSLVITERPLVMPPTVMEQYKRLVAPEGWQRPDGEELFDALQVATCARQLACGFYYRWRWPRQEPAPVRQKWLDVRKEWHRELREKLKHSKEHMDSPLLLWQACERWFDGYVFIRRDEHGKELERREIPPFTKNGPKPTWAAEWFLEWRRVKDTAQPETEAVWLDDFMLNDASAWLAAHPGLLWYEFSAFAEELARRNRGTVVHAGPGEDGNQRVLKLTGKERCIISIKAHGTGKNLQMFHRNHVANPPSGGDAWEQMLGRTHRSGQEADEVTVEVYRHTPEYREAVQTARDLAVYIQGTFGGTQKLASRATWGF